MAVIHNTVLLVVYCIYTVSYLSLSVCNSTKIMSRKSNHTI